MATQEVENEAEKVKKTRPPFQLCFASSHTEGRSELSRPKLPKFSAAIITSKFYTDEGTTLNKDDPTVQKLASEIEELRNKGPREKYTEPLLESHNYGWHPEPLIPVDKTDRRLHHHRITSDMVKVQMILHNARLAEKEFEKLIVNKNK